MTGLRHEDSIVDPGTVLPEVGCSTSSVATSVNGGDEGVGAETTGRDAAAGASVGEILVGGGTAGLSSQALPDRTQATRRELLMPPFYQTPPARHPTGPWWRLGGTCGIQARS
jgi:hypothetical protein